MAKSSISSNLLGEHFQKEVKCQHMIVGQGRKKLGEGGVWIYVGTLLRGVPPAPTSLLTAHRTYEYSQASRRVPENHELDLMQTFVSVNFSSG